jgi:hypothetical protein
MGIASFSKIAPYMTNRWALVGFCLFLFFGMLRVVLKGRLLVPLSQRQSAVMVGRILNYGFLVAILVIVSGVYRERRDLASQSPVTQQSSGDKGNHNQTIKTNNGVAVQENQK